MNIEKADIVQSVAGRDQGGYFLVLDVQDEYLLLVDGKIRKLETPKRKKSKHVLRIRKAEGPLAEKIRSGENLTNKEIRNAMLVFDEAYFSDQEEK